MMIKPFANFFLAASLVICSAACSHNDTSGNKKVDTQAKVDSAKVEVHIDSLPNENPGDFANYYVVIADTGLSYKELLKKMTTISIYFDVNIDFMNRKYDEKRDLIALPENDPDEIYAGEYYPRRYPSNFLSLEYLSYFQENAREKTIALVAGIYEEETSADSALHVFREKEPRAFKIKSHIYVGCMH